MMRRWLICIVAVLVYATGSSSLASAEQDPSATVRAATRLGQLFSDLLKPFAEIGATAERQHLVDNLIALNRDLFDLEQDKRYTVLALKRRPLNQPELVRTAASLEQKITRLRNTLNTLGPKLRIAYRKGADESIDLLSEALVTRKGFVANLALTSEASANEQIVEAEAAVQALSRAQKSLADAIDNLQRQQ